MTNAIPVPWKRVAVFVSSTFNDMHAERDYLVKRVFPDLHDWCERRRLRLVDVDLRWGVTEADATQNRNVVQTCLKRIDECRPFFLCFIGQRRGWVPMPEGIHPRTLDAFPELRRYIGKASVTELEILHAILRPLHGDAPHDPARDPDTYRPADHAFFYLRDSSYLTRLPAELPELLAAYTNAGGDDPARQAHDDAELRRWREVEIPKCGRPVHPYSAEWNAALSTPELALPLVCPASAEQGRDRWRERWARAGVGLAPDGLQVADENRAQDFNRRLTAGRLSEFRQEEDDLRNAREAVLVILRQERPFLARRDGRHDFFYESFQTAARGVFCLGQTKPETVGRARPPGAPSATPDPSARPAREWHRLIADQYAAQPNTNRRLSELPHHLTSAERWDQLIGDDDTPGVLTDPFFIQAKCEAGMVYELVRDYNVAPRRFARVPRGTRLPRPPRRSHARLQPGPQRLRSSVRRMA